ncbi:MAG: DNA-3-methyladenine glycosylase I [Candidatus Eremiobacteraeota bacterium]|nr:DNA-3-methyladenine glycosylase I [Candidatus Eremiobacteraeota bacterium]
MAETIPDVIEPRSLADYFEVMTRAVFQAGVSWKQIAQHWDAYREAFESFDTSRVAAYDEADVDRILATPGVLRMRRKIHATIRNARAMLDADRENGGFVKYLRSFDSYAALAKDFKKRFALMGDMNVWYFLFRTGENVPRFEQWVATIRGEHPRMREMVERARAMGRSREAEVNDDTAPPQPKPDG